MLQNGFIIPQIGFKFDSIKRKNGFNNASCLPQQCLMIGVKPDDFRNETGQQEERKQPQSILVTWSPRGHYKVTTFRFSFMNGSNSPILEHFGRVCCVVAFRIWFRYVSNLVFMNGSSSSRYSDHFGRVCYVVAFRIRFEFSFMNGASFEPILGSFWSHMLRGCVPDSVSLRFEFSFHNGSSFELILGSFWSYATWRVPD